MHPVNIIMSYQYCSQHSCEQVLEATPHKAPTIWPPTPHHENYPNRYCTIFLKRKHNNVFETSITVHRNKNRNSSYQNYFQKLNVINIFQCYLSYSGFCGYIYIYIYIYMERVDTAIWMHHLDANKTAGEEARQQLLKNVVSNTEQVLVATPHKATTIRPPASHHENYPN